MNRQKLQKGTCLNYNKRRYPCLQKRSRNHLKAFKVAFARYTAYKINFQQTPEENMTQFMAGQRAARSWMLAITVLSYVWVLPVLAQEKSGASAGKYNGPGSCSASSCHGGVQMADENTRAQTRTHI